MEQFEPIVAADYGPLDPKVVLEPDFFTGFDPARRSEIVTEEAKFYHDLTQPYSVDDRLAIDYIKVPSFDGTEIAMKTYRPQNAAGKLPTFVFIHGGGYKTCGVETHNFVPAYLVANAGVMAFNIEYRLAPEHKYPTGIEDCYAVLQWVEKNADALGLDANKLAVGGDSSGGNFAIALTLMAKARGGPVLNKQVLIYPVTDLTGSVEKKSAQVYAMVGSDDEGGGNDLSQVYLPPDTDAKDPLVSPLFAPDLGGLPEALVIQAECDALLDDGLFYAKRLQDAGVSVTCHVYKGMPHAFILRTYEETFAALNTICHFLAN